MPRIHQSNTSRSRACISSHWYKTIHPLFPSASWVKTANEWTEARAEIKTDEFSNYPEPQIPPSLQTSWDIHSCHIFKLQVLNTWLVPTSIMSIRKQSLTYTWIHTYIIFHCYMHVFYINTHYCKCLDIEGTHYQYYAL